MYRLPPGAAGPELLIPHRKAIGGLVAQADGGFVVSGRNVSIKGDDGATTVLLEAASVFSLDADRTGLPAPVARVRPSWDWAVCDEKAKVKTLFPERSRGPTQTVR